MAEQPNQGEPVKPKNVLNVKKWKQAAQKPVNSDDGK